MLTPLEKWQASPDRSRHLVSHFVGWSMGSTECVLYLSLPCVSHVLYRDFGRSLLITLLLPLAVHSERLILLFCLACLSKEGRKSIWRATEWGKGDWSSLESFYPLVDVHRTKGREWTSKCSIWALKSTGMFWPNTPRQVHGHVRLLADLLSYRMTQETRVLNSSSSNSFIQKDPCV